MANINRLYRTLRLIKGALFPKRQAGLCFPSPASGSITEISPAEYAVAFAGLTGLLRPDGRLALHFDGALFPAAPFVLYRLKSAGFSDCRAVVTAHGILLTGRR